MPVCYFCEFCDFVSEEDFSAAELLEHINKKHTCGGYMKNNSLVPCPIGVHHGANKNNERVCTLTRQRSLLCCVCEKTYVSTAEYLDCINIHVDSQFLEEQQKLEQRNENIVKVNDDDEFLALLESIENIESQDINKLNIPASNKRPASPIEFQQQKRICTNYIKPENMDMDIVLVPETRPELLIPDDDENEPDLIPATPTSPNPDRSWRSMLPDDPIVHFPGCNDDFRECVSPIDTEDELDDIHPNIQVGCGVSDKKTAARKKKSEDVNADEEPGNYSQIEDNDDQIRFVNDIKALKLKECKFCQDDMKFSTVGALLEHIKLTHGSIYRKYLETIQTGEGIDENSPDFDINLKIATKDNITQNYVVDITAETEADNRPVHWTDFNAFMKALIKSLAAKLESIYAHPLYYEGMRITQYKVLFQTESLYSRPDSEEEYQRHAFCSPMYFIRQPEDIYDAISLMIAYFMQRNDDYTIYGSGWVHERVVDFQFTITRAKVMDGTGSQDLPALLVGKIRSLFNVSGDGSEPSNKCFMHAIISKFELFKHENSGSGKKKHPKTVKKFRSVSYYDNLFEKLGGQFTYKKLELQRRGTKLFENMSSDEITIDFTGIKFPFSLTQLKKFQLLNPGLGLSVMGFDDEENPKKTTKKKNDKIQSRQFIEDSDDSLDEEEEKSEEVEEAESEEELEEDILTANQESESITSTDQKPIESRVFKYKKDQIKIRRKIHPFYVTPYSTDIMLDILYVYRADYGHFLNVKNLHALLDKGTHQNRDLCRFCIQWRDKKNIQEHIENCRGLGRCKTIMPTQNLFFRNFWKTLPSPYTFFLDFECLLIKNIKEENSEEGDIKVRKEEKNSQMIQHHKPSGYSWYCINWRNEVVERVVYRQDPSSVDPEKNEDVGNHCIRTLLEFAGEKLEEIESFNKNAYQEMNFQSEEHKLEIETRLKDNNFIKNDKAIDCCICNKPLENIKSEENETEYIVTGSGKNEKKEKKQCVVKHHSHVPDYEFLGLAHSTPCNMNARIRKTFSCFAHNWTGYDSHIIVMATENKKLVTDMKLMGSSTEKITALTLNDVLRFCDSISFFGGASLDSTVKSLGPTDFDIFKAELKGICTDRGLVWDNLTNEFKQEIFERLKNKGAFPYTYMDSFEKFKETTLPPKVDFFNDLSEFDIEDSVYDNALRVWDMLKIQNLGEWHDLYVRIDTLLLTTCFVKLRKVMMDSFSLDVTHYVSLPSYTMDACLRHTKRTIELTQDPDVYIFLEQAVLGGLCTIGDEKVALANNEYCGNQYNPSKPKSWLVYLDKNNLYGASMITKLPVKNYQFVPDSTLALYNRYPNRYVNKLEDDGDYGQIWDVTLEYPGDTYDYFNAFPPAHSRKTVSEQKVSCEQRRLANAFSVGKTAWSTEKVIACLEPKRLKCHYRALKLWVKLGVAITKVHKVLGFDQDEWMKEYVDYNSKQRALTKNKVEQNLRKLLNNSLYGKQIQNVRDKINMVLLNSSEQRMRYAKKPTLKHIRILSENLVLAVIDRTSVTLNSNMASGVVILEQARLNMYKFWYEFIKPNYPTASLLYSDTDSQVIKIECENVYDEMLKHSEEFDMSDYNPNHAIWGKYYDDKYRKTVNKMKDECSNSVLTKFCALKSKLYSYESVQINDKGDIIGKKQEKKMKGVPRVAAKRTKFEEYLECIQEPKQTFASFKTIRSKNHQLVTLQQSKKCLNRFDNKRFEITPTKSLALGHRDIPLYNDYIDYKWLSLRKIGLKGKYERKVFRRLCMLSFPEEEKTVQDIVG